MAKDTPSVLPFSLIPHLHPSTMFGRIHLSPAGKVPFLGSWIAAVCSRVYIRLCSVFANLQPRLAEPALSCIPARGEAEQLEPNEKPPYSKDTLPGGRPFTTVYGTIQVFEWGPERGEKVLIIHGLSTPCIALGNMAKGFVDNGYRVMMFGESWLYHLPAVPVEESQICCRVCPSQKRTSLLTLSQIYLGEATRMPPTI